MFVVCERWVGDGDRLPYWPKFFLARSSTSFASWLGLLNRESLRAAKPSVCKLVLHAGILSPTFSNHLDTWLYYCHVHLLLLFFRLFTQVHLLIDGSVEGQYITKALEEWSGEMFRLVGYFVLRYINTFRVI